MPDELELEQEPELEPTVAAASPGGWRDWLANLVHFGRRRLGATGLTLLAGFAAGLAALYLFAEIAEDVLDQDAQPLDDAVRAWLQQFMTPELNLLALAISMLGSEILAVVMVLLIAWLASQRRWGACITLILVVVGAQLLNDVLKGLFQRTRPAPVAVLVPTQQFSFPSGHAMVSAAFYLFLAYLSWRILGGWRRLLAVATLLTLIGAIGLTRLYLEAHYLSDVIAGYLAGFLWVLAVILGGRLLGRPSAAGHWRPRAGPVRNRGTDA